MSQVHLRKYNVLLTTAKAITFSLFEVDGIDLRVDATFATGDVTISIDGGAEQNTTNLPVDEGKGYSLILTATELSSSQVRVSIVDQTATKVWLDIELVVETYGNASAMHAFDLDTASSAQTGDAFARLATYRLGELMSAALASQPFAASLLADLTQDNPDATGTQQFTVAALMRLADEVLTGATHNVNNSWGKRIRGLSGSIFSEGTAQSGGNNTIQLASGDITTDEQFRRSKVIIVGGTGTGQEAIITSSVASTDTLTITPAWLTNPDATSEYEILPAQTHSTVRNGGYDGAAVYVDTVNGVSGTQKGVNGTSTNPVDNLTDAYVIAANEMITKYQIEPGSTITMPNPSTDKTFEGRNYNVLLNSADIDNSFFEGASIAGIATAGSGNAPGFFLCGIGSVTLPPCNGTQCGFFGTFTIGSAGNFTFGESATVFDSQITIDYGVGNNSSGFFLQSWGGGTVEIQNAGAGTGSYSFGMSAVGGSLLINANCSATTVVRIFGPIELTNNATGITIDNVINATSVDLATVDSNVDQLLIDVAVLPTPAEVNAEVVDVLEVDTHAEPTSVVGATATIKDAIMFTKVLGRNKMTQTATTTLLRNDADSGTIATSTVSDDTTTFTKGKLT